MPRRILSAIFPLGWTGYRLWMTRQTLSDCWITLTRGWTGTTTFSISAMMKRSGFSARLQTILNDNRERI